MNTPWKAAVFSVLVPITLIGVWQFAASAKLLPPSQSVSPLDVVRSLAILVGKPPFRAHVTVSVERLAVGLSFGAVAAIGVSMWVALSSPARLAIAPSLAVLGGVPVLVWMPFWIMIFGVGECFKIGMVAISTFFLVYAFALSSFLMTHRSYFELAAMYEKPAKTICLEILLPASASAIITALRISVALGWVVLFFVEYAAATRGVEGLGWYVADARNAGQVEEEFAGLALVGVIGFVFDFTLKLVGNWCVRWDDSVSNSIPLGLERE